MLPDGHRGDVEALGDLRGLLRSLAFQLQQDAIGRTVGVHGNHLNPRSMLRKSLLDIVTKESTLQTVAFDWAG